MDDGKFVGKVKDLEKRLQGLKKGVTFGSFLKDAYRTTHVDVKFGHGRLSLVV